MGILSKLKVWLAKYMRSLAMESLIGQYFFSQCKLWATKQENHPESCGGMHNGASDRLMGITLSLAKSWAHRVQETGLWEFPDEAWYPHPHSVQQHGRLKSRAWACSPGSWLYLRALPSTLHKQRASPSHLSSHGQGFYQEWSHLPKLCCLPATCLL